MSHADDYAAAVLSMAGFAPADPADPRRTTHQLRTLEELDQDPIPDDLIEGLASSDALIVPYGPSGVGKTFWALYLALCVTEGIPFHGLKVRRGVVVYVVFEGARRFRLRVRAACDALGIDSPVGLYICTDAIYPHDPASVAGFIAAVRAKLGGEAVVLVILDTLSRASAGSNENATGDRELTIDGLRRIQQAAGGAIMPIAHTGWNEDRLRGGYALQAAADLILQLKGGETDKSIKVRVEKSRDFDSGGEFNGVLTSYDGTLIYEPAETAEEAPQVLSSKMRVALEALASTALSDGITSSEWQQAAGLSASSFFRVRKSLVAKGLVSVTARRKYTVSPDYSQLPNNFQATSMGVRELLPPLPHSFRSGSVEVPRKLEGEDAT